MPKATKQVPSQTRAEKQASGSTAEHPGGALSSDVFANAPSTEGRDVHTKKSGKATVCAGNRRLGHVSTCPVELSGDEQRVELVRDYPLVGYDKGTTLSVPCAIQYVAWRPERIS